MEGKENKDFNDDGDGNDDDDGNDGEDVIQFIVAASGFMA